MPDRKLPPLQSLLAFEAAARWLNFTRAAEELGTTQSAVSQQIRLLEVDIPALLFRRLPRGVALTAEGEALAEAVRRGLGEIQAAIEALRPGRQRRIRLATDFGFAAWWLMPRLATLGAAFPEVDLDILTSQRPWREAGGTDEEDIAILFGAGTWAGRTARLLFPERVTPVRAPSLPAETTPLNTRLLHLQGPDAHPGWLSWADWFRSQGIAPPAGTGLAFNNYHLLLQAALEGQGVALGWTPLVDDLLRDGRLLPAGEPVNGPGGYYLVEPRGRPRDTVMDHLRAWIIAACRQMC